MGQTCILFHYWYSLTLRMVWRAQCSKQKSYPREYEKLTRHTTQSHNNNCIHGCNGKSWIECQITWEKEKKRNVFCDQSPCTIQLFLEFSMRHYYIVHWAYLQIVHHTIQKTFLHIWQADQISILNFRSTYRKSFDTYILNLMPLSLQTVLSWVQGPDSNYL